MIKVFEDHLAKCDPWELAVYSKVRIATLRNKQIMSKGKNMLFRSYSEQILYCSIIFIKTFIVFSLLLQR